MRVEKLTTKFQEALSDAQTLVLGADQAYIEPAHLMVAMLRQTDGPQSLLMRAGVAVPALLQDAQQMMARYPQVQGQDQVQVGRELVGLIQAAEKKASSARTSTLPANCFFWPWPITKGTRANWCASMVWPVPVWRQRSRLCAVVHRCKAPMQKVSASH